MSDTKKLLNLAREIINEVDPALLINGGAPKDEYDSETIKVISIMGEGVNNDKKKMSILKLFENNFEDTPLKKGFADEIIRLWTVKINRK
jgi:hypothetical protein